MDEIKDDFDFGAGRFGCGARNPECGSGRIQDLFLEDHHVAAHLHGGAFGPGIRFGFSCGQTESKVMRHPEGGVLAKD